MIHGFLNSKIVSAEEYLIDYSIRIGQSIHIPTDLLNMPITFDNKEVYAFVLDITSNNDLVLQLVLPIKEKFDDKSNVYKTSYIRKLLNSRPFLNRFNVEFINRIKQTVIHTNDYITYDKLWLLSHEEINLACKVFLKMNKTCKSFNIFKYIELESYSKTILKLNQQCCYGWWLRSNALSAYSSDGRGVGYVNYGGNVSHDYARLTGAILPTCIIS